MPLPETGLVRLKDIIGDPSRNIPPFIPVSRTTWFEGIKSGRYPKGVLISPGCRAWRVEEIRALEAAL